MLGTGTGAHGVTSSSADDESSETGIFGAFDDLFEWLNTPFTTPLDPWSLFLGVGVVIFAIIAWNLILYHVRLAAQTVIE